MYQGTQGGGQMRLAGSSGAGAGLCPWPPSWRAGRAAAAGVAAALALAATALAGVPAASADVSETVIVTSSGALSPVTAVLDAGGTVLTQYHIIDGVDATILTAEEPVLAALPGITVTPDLSVSVQSTVASTGPHTPSDAFLPETGATQLASAGDTGQGVTVAVLDTGIASLPDFSGRLAAGVDLTGSGDPFTDSYGHGTFVAGLIAGDGASSDGAYSGEAPGASLVSVKVAGADGTTHLGTLISGLQWVADHQSTYHIGVLNISLGFRPTQSTVNNPLDRAVEAVWNSGIVVVASAGNAGPFNGTILSPGDDPLVITAGALDDMATAQVSDDEMTDFSSAGPTTPDGWVKPDLVTSGRSVVSLAVPGSAVYDSNPSARVGAAGFAGSGTSFSAAIVSGAAALVLARNPGLSPNQVKARLLGTTLPGPAGNPLVDGHGALNAFAAATSGPLDLSQSAAGLAAEPAGATVSLSPTRPVDSWNPSLWSGLSWTAQPDTGWAWNGWGWNGGGWNGWAWNDRAWNGWAWNGAQWNGGAWSGWAWNGAAWAGSAWAGSAWAGSAWAGSAWN
jgi:serine protease AprX